MITRVFLPLKHVTFNCASCLLTMSCRSSQLESPITTAFENMRPLGNTRRRFPDQFRRGGRMPGRQVNSTYMNRKVFQLSTSSWLNLSIGWTINILFHRHPKKAVVIKCHSHHSCRWCPEFYQYASHTLISVGTHRVQPSTFRWHPSCHQKRLAFKRDLQF